MNPEQILAHLKRLSSTLTPRQIATLAGVFVAVVGLVAGSAYWINTPSYTLLYSGLDAESAAAVITRLKDDKVPYVLDDGGTAVRVPVERVDELRLNMASEGLPTTGRIGFEVFDRTAFGTTESLEQVTCRRGLEGELARTISTIAEIASARVHIAPAKDSLFTEDVQQAKASVVLKLRSKRPLAASTVAGIAGLVAGSVESLRPESVVILDTFGRPLSQVVMSDEEAAAGLPVERQQKLERDLSAKVVALIEPVAGVGHVRANVSVRLTGNSEEQTEERWDPTTVIRSRQSTSDSGGGPASVGIAGARANAVPGLNQTPRGVVASPPPVLAGRSTETVNYEVNKLTRHTLAPPGQLARLSVAVIVDDEHTVAKDDASGQPEATSKPRSPEDIERIQRLVAAAIGLDPARGDQVTVENIAFDEAPGDATPDAQSWWRRIPPQLQNSAPQLVRLVGVLLLTTLAFTMVLRPMVRAAFPADAGSSGLQLPSSFAQPVRSVADLEGEIEARLDAGLAPPSPEAQRLPALTKRIAKKATEEPELMARLVRSLLVDEER